MSRAQLSTQIGAANRRLTATEFHDLAEVPPELEWYANLDTIATKRAYKEAIGDFMRFTGIARPEDFRIVTRAHVLAWRDDLAKREYERRGQKLNLSGATIRYRLAALSSLFEYLCERNAVMHNPVKGVRRPRVEGGEGKTPAIGDRLGSGHTPPRYARRGMPRLRCSVTEGEARARCYGLTCSTCRLPAGSGCSSSASGRL
jgi:integrase/recombinase XerD